MNKNTRVHLMGAVFLFGAMMPGAMPAQVSTVASSLSPVQTLSATTMAKLSPDAQAANPLKMYTVIIQFNTANPALQQLALVSVGGVPLKLFQATKAVTAQLPGSVLPLLANNPILTYISLDRPLGARQAVQPISVNADYTTGPINALGIMTAPASGLPLSIPAFQLRLIWV